MSSERRLSISVVWGKKKADSSIIGGKGTIICLPMTVSESSGFQCTLKCVS